MKAKALIFVLGFISTLIGVEIFIFNLHKEKKKNLYQQELCKLINEWALPDIKKSLKHFCLANFYKYTEEETIIAFNKFTYHLEWSHLSISEPQESTELWQKKYTNNGLKVKKIDGAFIILESKIDKSFKKGDEILYLEINQELTIPSSVFQTESHVGPIVINRNNKDLKISAKHHEYKVNKSHEINYDIKTNTSTVKLTDFYKYHYSNSVLNSIYSQVKDSKQIIIDLRDNRGGNFIAGSLFLSLFQCNQKHFSSIIRPTSYKPKNKLNRPLPYITKTQDINDELFIEKIKNNSVIKLKTFQHLPCLKQPLSVFINNSTSSVAEMVALSLKENKGAKLYGKKTAGKLLVSLWWPLEIFKPNTMISIPIGKVISSKGYIIESNGVIPDKNLDYDLYLEKQGIDSWYKEWLNLRP